MTFLFKQVLFAIVNYRKELEAQPTPKEPLVEKAPAVPKASESSKKKKKGSK